MPLGTLRSLDHGQLESGDRWELFTKRVFGEGMVLLLALDANKHHIAVVIQLTPAEAFELSLQLMEGANDGL